jgi:hypothetical protein
LLILDRLQLHLSVKNVLILLVTTLTFGCLMFSISYFQALDACVNAVLKQRGSTLCNIFSWESGHRGKPITLKDVDALQHAAGSDTTFSCALVRTGTIHYQQTSRPCKIICESSPMITNERVNTYIRPSGQLQNSPVVVIDSALAQKLLLGNTNLGETLSINGVPCTLLGIVPWDASNPSMGTAWLPLSTGARRLFGTDSLDRVYFKPPSEQTIDGAIAAVRQALRQRHHLSAQDQDDFFIMSASFVRESYRKGSATTRLLLTTLSLIAFLLTVLLSAFILASVVHAEGGEIAIKRAVGANRVRIATEYLGRSLSLFIGGTIIAAVLLIPIFFIIRQHNTDEAFPLARIAFHWESFSVTFFSACASGSVSSLLAIRRALAIEPSSTL